MPDPRDLPPPALIQRQDQLERCAAEIAGATALAVDTEADSFYSYREKVCLIQLTARGRDWIVDPLAGLDLTPLGRLLADPAVQKILHDGEYDASILHRDFGFRFQNVFDTRVAAAALGNKTPGLASVLREHFGVELDKSLQRSDWGRRPLSAEQIEYARLDTHYLLALKEEQGARLVERGRDRIVLEESRRLESIEPSPKTVDPDGFLRIKGARALAPLELRALRELYLWREREAEARDVPPFKVLNNDSMLELAQVQPRDERELSRRVRLSPRQVRQHGAAMLETLARARALGPPPARDAREREGDAGGALDEAGWELHERLKSWRKQRGDALELEYALVLHRRALHELARLRPLSAEQVARAADVLPWQAERFSEELAALVRAFEADLAAGRVELSRRRGFRSGSRPGASRGGVTEGE